VVADAGSEQILIIQLVLHSSHLSQLLDLCVFDLDKIRDQKEQKPKQMRGETLKIYRALLAFYKATIIPMVRWSFDRAGFRLNPHDLLGRLTLNPMEVLNRIGVPEMSLEQLISAETDEGSESQERPIRRRVRLPSLIEFADKLACVCPLCGHGDHQKASKEEKNADEQIPPSPPIRFSGDFDRPLNESFSPQLLLFCDNFCFRTNLLDVCNQHAFELFVGNRE
jgi:hypothetical protein